MNWYVFSSGLDPETPQKLTAEQIIALIHQNTIGKNAQVMREGDPNQTWLSITNTDFARAFNEVKLKKAEAKAAKKSAAKELRRQQVQPQVQPQVHHSPEISASPSVRSNKPKFPNLKILVESIKANAKSTFRAAIVFIILVNGGLTVFLIADLINENSNLGPEVKAVLIIVTAISSYLEYLAARWLYILAMAKAEQIEVQMAIEKNTRK